MSQTQTALINAVLEELGALGSGQVASAEDVASIQARISPTIQDLTARKIIYIPDTDTVPDEVFNHLAEYLTEICAPKFGRPQDKVAKQMAEDKLRVLQRIGTGTGDNLRVDAALVYGRRSVMRLL